MSDYVMPMPSTDPAINTAAFVALRTRVAADGSGWISFPSGDYTFQLIGGSGPNQTYALELPPQRFAVVGAGHGATRLRLAAGSPTWARVIGTNGSVDGRIAHLTVDGNKAAVSVSEQSHGIFLSSTERLTIENLAVYATHGDGIYWHNYARRNVIRGVHLDDIGRVGIHAQTFESCAIRESFFTGAMGQGCIKTEQDNPGTIANGLTIANNHFDGDGSYADNFAILISGFDSANRALKIIVEGNQIKRFRLAIGLGIWSTGWNISGNIIDSCHSGIVETNYAVTYGYDSHEDISIAGNDLLYMIDAGYEEWAISLSNARVASILGNTASVRTRGLRLRHCTDIDTARNNIMIREADGMGVMFYRSPDVSSLGDSVRTAGGVAYGAYIADDATYIGTPAQILDFTVRGHCQYGIRRDLINPTLVTVRDLIAADAVYPLY